MNMNMHMNMNMNLVCLVAPQPQPSGLSAWGRSLPGNFLVTSWARGSAASRGSY